MRVSLRYEGPSTCGRPVSYVIGEGHGAAVRNTATNCWNVNMNTGNVNNNNTYNRYFVVGASDSVPNAGEWFVAERSFFKNKHRSVGAQRIHMHPGRVMRVARGVQSGTWSPRPGYCFPILEPAPRQIFAAFCEDRLVHHYVAPFLTSIAEAVHVANGNVSHGNRINFSAHTGAIQIRDAITALMTQYPDAYILKIDFKSFFNSIPRARAFELVSRYAREYYAGPDREEKLAICRKLIMHDPVDGCVRLAKKEMERIPPAKRMENAPEGCGFPIGNFYSQLVANLYLAELDRRLMKYGVCPRFVDDKCCVVKDVETAKACLAEARQAAEELGIRIHPDKIYIQPAHRGVNFCGRTIKGGRIYLSNRTIQSARRKVKEAAATEEAAVDLCNTVNSYLGMFRHCTEWQNEKRLADLVLKRHSQWLYFVLKGGHFVCRVKKTYIPRVKRENDMTNLIEQAYVFSKTYQRRHRSR